MDNKLNTEEKATSKADVRRSALEWWGTLPNKNKKQITDKNIDILMKGIARTWQRLTDREIEKLFKVQHFI